MPPGIDPSFGRSWLRRVRPFAIGALLLATSGFAYERIGEWQEHRRFPQVGRSVDIGGRKLNIYCSGRGAPTVMFESGHSVPGLGWAVIQPQVARFTKACWYDRAGYGWSEPGPFPQRSNEIAHDLHQLLTGAKVRPPFVLVGHLFGAFNIRAFQHSFPQVVTGMVLIDPASESSAATTRQFPRIAISNR